MYATEDLADDTLILAMPKSLLITSDMSRTAPNSASSVVERDCPDIRSAHNAIATFILEQRDKGSASEWKAYIDVLKPLTFDTMPVHWDKSILPLLKGSFLLDELSGILAD